jgi:hypothetical protein
MKLNLILKKFIVVTTGLAYVLGLPFLFWEYFTWLISSPILTLNVLLPLVCYILGAVTLLEVDIYFLSER